MGRPARIDSPRKITVLLSAACHQQMEDLCSLYQAEPRRRTQVSKSEVIELAVAALHTRAMPTAQPRQKADRTAAKIG